MHKKTKTDPCETDSSEYHYFILYIPEKINKILRAVPFPYLTMWTIIKVYFTY